MRVNSVLSSLKYIIHVSCFSSLLIIAFCIGPVCSDLLDLVMWSAAQNCCAPLHWWIALADIMETTPTTDRCTKNAFNNRRYKITLLQPRLLAVVGDIKTCKCDLTHTLMRAWKPEWVSWEQPATSSVLQHTYGASPAICNHIVIA